MLEAASESGWQTVGSVDLYDYPRNLRRRWHHNRHRYRRRGTPRHSLNLLRNYAFKHLSLHQLFAEVPASNEASVKLFQKAGYISGQKKSDWIKGECGWEDVLCMQFMNNFVNDAG